MGHGRWDVEALNGEGGEIQAMWRSGGCKGIFGESEGMWPSRYTASGGF